MIDPTEQPRIRALLHRIESDHGIRILYACESGSRAWVSPHLTAIMILTDRFARSPLPDAPDRSFVNALLLEIRAGSVAAA